MYEKQKQGERMSLKDAGLLTLLLTMIIWLIVLGFMVWKENFYERAYWSGRNEGWKASLDHQQRLQSFKSRAVFDYEKD